MKVPSAFFEVSPYWAKAISEAKTVGELKGFCDNQGQYPNDSSGESHNIQNWNTCIVGEAWHERFSRSFSSMNEYGQHCKECLEFSTRFGAILRGDHDGRGNRKQQLVQNIKDFTDHWREEHNPLVDLETETEPITVRP